MVSQKKWKRGENKRNDILGELEVKRVFLAFNFSWRKETTSSLIKVSLASKIVFLRAHELATLFFIELANIEREKGRWLV